MERLKSRDYRALLDFVQGAYATTSLDGFAQRVPRDLRSIIPSDIGVCNEINHKLRRIEWMADGFDASTVSAEFFAAHMHEHPLVGIAIGQVRQITDFVTPREWKRRTLYAGFYRRLDVENVITVRLATSRPAEIIIAAPRGAREYSGRERLILQLAEPHLARAYANAEAATVQASEVSLLRQGIVELGAAAIVLGRDDRIRLMTERARQWLAEYFSARPAMALPDEIARWVRRNSAPARAAGALPQIRLEMRFGSRVDGPSTSRPWSAPGQQHARTRSRCQLGVNLAVSSARRSSPHYSNDRTFSTLAASSGRCQTADMSAGASARASSERERIAYVYRACGGWRAILRAGSGCPAADRF